MGDDAGVSLKESVSSLPLHSIVSPLYIQLLHKSRHRILRSHYPRNRPIRIHLNEMSPFRVSKRFGAFYARPKRRLHVSLPLDRVIE